MKQAFDGTSKPVTPAPAKVEPAKPAAPLAQPKATNTVKETPRAERPPAPPAQRPARKEPLHQHADIPTAVKQIAREDVDITNYGIKPVATNFNVYNKELWKWLTGFSSDNRFNGGVPITKSQLMEICLDVIMYDLDIEPIGYESQQELREAIQRKLKS